MLIKRKNKRSDGKQLAITLVSGVGSTKMPVV